MKAVFLVILALSISGCGAAKIGIDAIREEVVR